MKIHLAALVAVLAPSVALADGKVVYYGETIEVAKARFEEISPGASADFRALSSLPFPGSYGVLIAGAEEVQFCEQGSVARADFYAFLKDAWEAVDNLDMARAETILGIAREALPCLSEPTDARTIGEVFFARAILQFFQEDEVAAERSFREALSVDRTLVWDDAYPLEGKMLFLEVRAGLVGNPPPAVETTSQDGLVVLVDGQTAPAVLPGLHLATWKDKAGYHGALFRAGKMPVHFRSEEMWRGVVQGGAKTDGELAMLRSTFDPLTKDGVQEVVVLPTDGNAGYSWFVKATAVPFVFHDFAEKTSAPEAKTRLGGFGIGGGVVLLSRTLYGGPTIEVAIPVGQKAELHLGGNLAFSSYGGYTFVLPGIDLSFLGTLPERGRVRFLLGGGASAEFTKQVGDRSAVIVSGLFKATLEVKANDHAFPTAEVLLGGGTAGLHIGARVLLRFR